MFSTTPIYHRAAPAWVWQASSYQEELARGVPIILLGVLLAAFHYTVLRARFNPSGAHYSTRAYLSLLTSIVVGYCLAALFIYGGQSTDGLIGVRPFGIPGWALLGLLIGLLWMIIMDLSALWWRVERVEQVVEEGRAEANDYGTMLRVNNARRLSRHHSAPGAIWGRRVVRG